jgi:membrane-associated phospholipid phosphatase
MRSGRAWGKLRGVLVTLTPARVRRALPFAAAALAVVTLAAIAWLDQPVARYLDDHGHGLRAAWTRGLGVVEVAAGLEVWKWFAATVLVAAGCVLVVIPAARGAARACWFIAAVHVVGRLTTNELKGAFGRLRPSQWVERGGPTFFEDGVAFPSGHVAYFLGLVLPLAVVRPRIGVPLLLVPVLVGWARVATNAHFVGDVVGGAAWTALVTYVGALAFRVGRAPAPVRA